MFVALSSAQTWSYLGYSGLSGGLGQFVSVAVDSVGTPYVAYSSHPDGFAVAVKKCVGSSWVTVGLKNFSGPNQATFVRIAISPDGVTPYVVYSDADNGYKATVKKFNGTEWVTVGNALLSAAYAASTSLAFAPDGTPYLSYEDFGNGYKITVMKLSGTQWTAVGTPGFSTKDIGTTSLAIAKDGTPYVAYSEALSATNTLHVMKFNGVTWESVGNTSYYYSIQYPSLAIAPDGSLYVAFENDNNSAKATVLHLVNNAWSVIGSSISDSRSFYVKLVVSGDGTPYLTYTDANAWAATTKKFANSTWSQVGISTAAPNYYMDFALAKDGSMYVGFDDYNKSNWVSVFKMNGVTTDSKPIVLSPITLNVFQNANSEVIIHYQINQPTKASLTVYNIQGQLISTLLNGNVKADYNEVSWNTTNYPKGVYMIELRTSATSQKSKICIQ